jgi:WD40 repeat protein
MGPRTEPIHSIACLPGGRVLVGQFERGPERPRWVSDRSGPLLIETSARDDLGVPISVCPEGRRIAAGGADRPLRIAELRDGEPVVTAEWTLGANAVWRPDAPSQLLAVTRYHAYRRTPPTPALAKWERDRAQRLLVIDTETGRVEPVGSRAFPLSYHWRGLLALTGDGATALLGDGQYLYALSMDDGEQRWADATRATLTASAARWALAASPCGRFVATGGQFGRELRRHLEIRDAATGRVRVGFASVGSGFPLRALAFHPSGDWVAAGLADGTVVHATPKGRVTSYRLGKTAIDAIAFPPGGETLLAGGVSGELWEVRL